MQIRALVATVFPGPAGGGDVVTNVFVLGQRFDFATFDALDGMATRGSRDELGRLVSQQSIANERATIGMFGAAYIEMLAREMTIELQSIRDSLTPGRTQIAGRQGGRVRHSFTPPKRDVRPPPSGRNSRYSAWFRQVPLVNPVSVYDPSIKRAESSLREFSSNAFNHHHGIQSTERFGIGTDPDGDGFKDEMTRADVTAVSVYQAMLPVPGRVIPNVPAIRAAIELGEERFSSIGCARCHIPSLPLSPSGRVYTEPNPFNPPGNLQRGEAPDLRVDLSDDLLPKPRLRPDRSGFISVPAYTDFKLHDISTGPKDPGREPLDMQTKPRDPSCFLQEIQSS